MKNKNQTVFEGRFFWRESFESYICCWLDSDQEETTTGQANGKNGTTTEGDQQKGDLKNFNLSKKTIKKLKGTEIESFSSS